MTTPNVTSSTDSQMHNNIMAAGSRDRPPMLATGRYPQWHSRFLRYIDTRPNARMVKKIYKPTNNNLRTSSNSRNKNVDTTLRYKNDNQSGQFRNQRTVNVAGARENELEAHYNYMAKIQEVPIAESGIDSDPVEHVQNDARYNMFANDLQHSKQSKSVSNTCLVETNNSNVIPDSPDMCEDDIQNDQNDVESDDEHVALANLIPIWNEKVPNVFRKERKQYIKNQDLKAQLQDKNIAISELKKLIEKGKGKSVDTKFDKPFVVRQPNAQRIPKPSVLCKSAPFSNSLERIYFLKTKSVPKTNVSEGLSKPVTAQTLPQTAWQDVSNINVLKPGMYRIDNRKTQTRAPQLPQTVRNTNPRVSTSIGVNNKTNVSRPHYKSNQLRDKVLPNNSQVKPKKTQVEVHPRIPSVFNKMKTVSACKDSLNSKTLNANAVCATCNKWLVDSNHFACVTKMLNNVNARTKKPNGNDLLTGNRGSDLYTISLQESTSSTPLCLMAKASPTQAWLWHRMLSHLNFNYINLLSKKDVVIGLPKLKYVKDQLCSSCEFSKAKRSLFKSKAVPSSKRRLNLLHMDLCGPMRVASINEKKYILVIVDDYSIYTWTWFLRSKDETPEVLKEFLTIIQRNLQALVITNDVVERRNRTLVEAAHTMLSASKLPLFFWAEAIATACYTQNRSIIIPTHDAHVPSQQEMDLLFGPLYNEFFNAEKVYRLWNALYGLKQAPKAWYDKLLKFLTSKGFTKGLQIHQSPHGIIINQARFALEILYKHGMEKGQSIGTPMATKPKLDADLSGNPVDQTDYRSKIGSLMYLTSSRPDIRQAICFCVRYQSRPTEKHLKEVKRIFRYLRSTVKIIAFLVGFDLIAFSDADHAGCIYSRKSTSGGIQFLGDKSVSWMTKKQNCTAMSSAEAEYMALSASYAQDMWMRT
uniref:GAG-pre-integrase domain-containing protein n=1 Tax=Tanacetum cinerariifolium TaxID=118510 RepID=A0A6L2JVC6_TANCI|nr:hypothetical protein [Tanacetum cinerariifolium]